MTTKCIMLLCANQAQYNGHCWRHVHDRLAYLVERLEEKWGKEEVAFLLEILDTREKLLADKIDGEIKR